MQGRNYWSGHTDLLRSENLMGPSLRCRRVASKGAEAKDTSGREGSCDEGREWVQLRGDPKSHQVLIHRALRYRFQFGA
jgi:hypothetical protein